MIQLKAFFHFLQEKQQIKKFNDEIPKFADFLIINLNAGMHPLIIIDYASKRKIFSKLLRGHLYQITNLCGSGCTLFEAVDIMIKKFAQKRSHRSFILLLIGLKISILRGAGSVKILEKMREKGQDEIQFARKLKVLTAQMRLQAFIITLSPLGLMLCMLMISPGHVTIFFESVFGMLVFTFMVVFNFCGYLFLKKILSIS